MEFDIAQCRKDGGRLLCLIGEEWTVVEVVLHEVSREDDYDEDVKLSAYRGPLANLPPKPAKEPAGKPQMTTC